MIRSLRPALTLVFCLLWPVLASAAPAAAADAVPVPDSMEVQGVPALPQTLAEELRPYENLRFAAFQSWHPSERRLLISTRFGETSQLHEIAMPMGARTQVTFFEERVSNGLYRPGTPSQVVFSIDEGGAENYQLLLLDRSAGKTRRLSDGIHRYASPLWSDDGELLAYVSNARNERDFDLYVQDPDEAGSERLVGRVEGFWSPLDWSADGKRLLVSHYVSANESSLHALDLASGTMTLLSPAPAEGEKTAWRGGEWAADGKTLYATTDAGGEFLRLVHLDPQAGTWKVLSDQVDWDVDGFDLTDDGRLLGYVTNEDGASKVHLYDTVTGERPPAPQLPPGVIGGGGFRPGSHEFGFTLSWAQAPSDVYSYVPEARSVVRWTASEAGGLPVERFSVPELVRFESFDGLEIPAFVYRPDNQRHPGPRPVYVDIHGGPEGQARPSFQGSQSYLTEELGVAIITPNVRGSSGYGKTYLTLDNAAKREDSVKDVGALLDWIAAQPDLDENRVMVGGSSYGGYMTLASMVHYAERLQAGFDYVGISNFVTFLENTQGYRRDLRRVEYGDERDPELRKILLDISPANHAARFIRPMLVAQGANDPRVPLSESGQIVAALSDNDIPVWYLVAEDEGHGFSKKTNADYLRLAWIEFIRRFLLTPEVPAAAVEGGR